MKKPIFLFFGLLFAMGNLGAQEKGQFVLQAEANAGILFCYPFLGTFNSIDIKGAIGPVFRYQVTNRFGVGIGANYCVHQFLQYMPIFADAKFSFGSGNAKPYAELRTGYAFSLKNKTRGQKVVILSIIRWKGFTHKLFSVIPSVILTLALVDSLSTSKMKGSNLEMARQVSIHLSKTA